MKHATHSHTFRKKLFTGLGIGLAGLLTLSSCAGDNTTTDTDTGASAWVVGHSFADLQNPMYAETRDGLEERMIEIGAEYQATDSRQDASAQLNDVENLIQRGVDLLIIDPVDETAIVPGIEAANSAGIPVLMLVKEPAGGSWDARIYLDQVAIGYAGCDYLASQLGESKKVIQLQGIMSVTGYRERAEGCEQALIENGVEIVAQQEGDGERTKSMDVVEALLKVHPDVNGIFGNNDEEALGAIEALRSSGIDLNSVVVVGIDGSELALESMCKSELAGTVSTPAANFVDAILQASSGILNRNLESPNVMFPYTLVTPENLGDMIEVSKYSLANCAAA